MVHLHENVESEAGYSKYMQSAGTCTTLIIIGGSTSKMLYQTLCGAACTSKPLTNVEWYLVFTCAAVLLSQLPNLNSIAGVSLLAALTAIAYCTLIWAVSVARGSLPNVSYDRLRNGKQIARIFDVLNALGIIAFAFRGHNHATMPSDETHPSRVPMWRGVKFAYILIATCLFPLAIGGYWAYGQLIPANGGMLTALYAYHSQDVARGVLGLISCCVIINAVTSFQIYGMPMFDDIQSIYTTKCKKECPFWLRAFIRTFFGFVCFFIAVAVPFLASFAGLIGGIALPVTFAYPCFMWLKVKKPKTYGPMWWMNWALGLMGMLLSVLLIVAGLYVVIDTGVTISFF
nr:lysine histidine transporter-like 8 [Ipomoea trifida]